MYHQPTRSSFTILIPSSMTAATSERGAACIYSDDEGVTWKAGQSVASNTTRGLSPAECQPVILSNGSILLSARDYDNSHHPLWAISDNGGETWHSLRAITTVLTATCDASLLALNEHYFYCRPDSLERKNLTVSSTADYGSTWSTVAQVWEGPAAYSCLNYVNSSYIGVLFESGTTSPYEAIQYASIRVVP